MKRILLCAAAGAVACGSPQKPAMPNVIIIMADDLGCGDVGILGSGLLETPEIDRLARSGLIFGNGYAAAPTSTPSRYALMTGCYPWKNRHAEVLQGDANLLINTGQPNLARLFGDAGYSTAAIGKWHLGLGNGVIDWNRAIRPSPADIGFGYSYIIAATNDRVPTVYVENGLVDGLEENDPILVSYTSNFEGEPTALTNPEMLKMKTTQGHNCTIVDSISRIGYMKGGHAARWRDGQMADILLQKAVGFIDRNRDRPFFMFYGLHQPHVPRVADPRFEGLSGRGPRGDVIMEADWCVGELLSHLERRGLLGNTIIIFTSDNGPVLDDGYDDMSDHAWGERIPAEPYRGGKYSLFDGGTHVPFFVSWPGHISPGSSEAVVCHMDLLASFAALTGQPAPMGTDSRNILDALTGKSPCGRDELVMGSEGRLVIRKGDWYLIPPHEGPRRNPTGNETGFAPNYALYDLSSDPGQLHDLSEVCPQKVEELKTLMEQITAGYYTLP